MPTTSSRSRGRQGMHSGGHGPAADHQRKIMGIAAAAAVVILFVLVVTTAGHKIDAATQHFMLFYAGVFALVGLTASVMVGLVATDRTVMTPGHRVMAQAVHRAVSFGALAFLVIHIVTEILAQRVHVIDAFIPFLSPFRTFYIGLGTIASDLILLLVVTGILRKRFTAHGKAWRWRAIHYSAYAAFVFGVVHGLLGGRAAKPYVDWSYGAAIAVTVLGLAVRFLASSQRPKESLSGAPGMDHARAPGSSPLHAAAMRMAQAQLSGPVQVLPAGMAARGANTGMSSDSWAALPAAPASAWSSPSGPFPALGPAASALGSAPAYATTSASGAYPVDPADPYRDLGFRPLGAPPYGDDAAAGRRGHPYSGADQPTSVWGGSTGMPGQDRGTRQPRYEPGYDGPPRFVGVPRGHVPQDELSSYPYGQPSQRQQLGAGYPGDQVNREEPAGRGDPRHSRAIEPPQPGSAPPSGQEEQRRQDNRNSGPTPRLGTGPMPRMGTGPMPRAGTGSMPRADTGSMPRVGTGPMPRPGSGMTPRGGTGSMPRPDTGPIPRADPGRAPRVNTGQKPRQGTGPLPVTGRGPGPRTDSGPMPRADTGSMPRMGTGPMPRADTGSMPRMGTGPMPRATTGPVPRPDTGPVPRGATGPMPRAARGSGPRSGTGPGPASGGGPGARPSTGPMPRVGPGPARTGMGPMPPTGTGALPHLGAPPSPADPASGPRGDRTPREAGRMSRRTNSADPRYREAPGPQGGDEWP
ncbi:MAG: hypothetical protein ABSB76_22535 [Streptosporangiaceae bacterium]